MLELTEAKSNGKRDKPSLLWPLPLLMPYEQRLEGAITFQWQVIVTLDAATNFETPSWTNEFASNHNTAAIEHVSYSVRNLAVCAHSIAQSPLPHIPMAVSAPCRALGGARLCCNVISRAAPRRVVVPFMRVYA